MGLCTGGKHLPGAQEEPGWAVKAAAGKGQFCGQTDFAAVIWALKSH